MGGLLLGLSLCLDAVVVAAAADGGGGDGGSFKRPDLILAAAVRTVSASVGATPETEADLSGRAREASPHSGLSISKIGAQVLMYKYPSCGCAVARPVEKC